MDNYLRTLENQSICTRMKEMYRTLTNNTKECTEHNLIIIRNELNIV